MAQLGWVGAGRLGLPIISKLLSLRHRIKVWDLEPAKIAEAAALGAIPATSAADAAVGARFVFLCLTNAQAVESVVFGQNGVMNSASSSMIIVDHTTIAPEDCQRFGNQSLQSSGIAWVDAPLSGGPNAAQHGDLIAWLGGRDGDTRPVKEFISQYCRRVLAMGPAGSGLLVKSCNQMVVCGTLAIWSEMFRFAGLFGLDGNTVIDALEGAAASSKLSQLFAPLLASGTFPRRSAENMLKDLGILTELAHERAFDPRIAGAALAEFQSNILPVTAL